MVGDVDFSSMAAFRCRSHPAPLSRRLRMPPRHAGAIRALFAEVLPERSILERCTTTGRRRRACAKYGMHGGLSESWREDNAPLGTSAEEWDIAILRDRRRCLAGLVPVELALQDSLHATLAQVHLHMLARSNCKF